MGKKVNGTVTKKWIYQDQLNPVAELNSSDSVITRYIYGTRANVPDYMIKDGNTYRVISDHLGSVRLVVNISDGSVVQRIDYDGWGNIISNLGSQVSDLTYAGGLYDEHTGFIRFGARDYDPISGRWTAKDPIGFAGGQSNLYEYVLNDPVNLVDINGLQLVSNSGARNFVNDQVTPIVNDIVEFSKTYTPYALTGFAVALTAGGYGGAALAVGFTGATLDYLAGNRNVGIVGGISTTLGAFTRDPKVQIGLILFPLAYDLMPDGKPIIPVNNPFGVADNTYVKISCP